MNTISQQFENWKSTDGQFWKSVDVDVDGIGNVNFDVAFGGAYYAYVKASEVNLLCTPDYYNQMIDIGRKIKRL